MGWTNPVTFVAGQLMDATTLNQQLRDNMNYLLTPSAALVRSAVGTYSTTSTTPATINAGFALTIGTNGGHVRVGGQFALGGVGTGVLFVDVDGTPYTAWRQNAGGGGSASVKLNQLFTGLAAGSHTFTPKWGVFAGTQTATIDNTWMPAEFWVIEG